MGVKELGHLVLFVENLERSRRFYGDVLGFPEIFRIGKDIVGFSSGRTHHELMLIEVGAAQPIPKGRRVGLYHFGLKVGDSDDDLRAALANLQKAGVPIVGASDHFVTHSLYILDPDGNEVELFIDVPGVDWKSDPSQLIRPPQPLDL